MTEKPRIHFHTDCEIFGGCENMLVNLISDQRLYENFEITFSYNTSKSYVDGLRSRLDPIENEYGLNLLSDSYLDNLADNKSNLLSLVIKVIKNILFLRYWILLINIIHLSFVWRSQKIDILHINNGGYPGASSARAAIIAGHLVGVPNILMVVNNIAVAPKIHEIIIESAINCVLCRCIYAFITGSNYASNALRRQLKTCNAKFTSLHNGIGNRMPNETAVQTRLRLNIKPNVLVFSIIALMEPRKGHKILIEAVNEINKQLSLDERPIIIIEGSGPEEAALRELVSSYQLNSQVIFIGNEKNIFNLIQCTDVLVVPSISQEDFPNVVIEAMSLGVPVVGTSIAGIPEQIEDQVSGWLVPPSEIEPLAQVLTRLVKNRELINMAGKRARIRFDAHFTAEQAVARYINVYKQILNS